MRGPTTPRGSLLVCGWLVAGSLALLSSWIPPLQLPVGHSGPPAGSSIAGVDQATYFESADCVGQAVRSVVAIEPGAASGGHTAAGRCRARFVPV